MIEMELSSTVFWFLSHTCCVYYPFDKPLLYQTGDALSNTSGANCFWHSPRLNASVTCFRSFSSIFHILTCISTTKTENYFSYKWVHPDNAMKTERFDCVSNTKTHQNNVFQDFYFTNSKHPYHCVQLRIIRLMFVL